MASRGRRGGDEALSPHLSNQKIAIGQSKGEKVAPLGKKIGGGKLEIWGGSLFPPPSRGSSWNGED